MTLDDIDINNPPKELGDFVNKLIDAKVQKSMAIAKKNMRKNCGADAKNQTSTPTRNGRGSNKGSSAPSHSANPTQKDKKQKAKKKKTTAQPQPNPNKSKGNNQRRGPPKPSEKPPPHGTSRRVGQGTGGGKRAIGVRRTPHGNRQSRD